MGRTQELPLPAFSLSLALSLFQVQDLFAFYLYVFLRVIMMYSQDLGSPVAWQHESVPNVQSGDGSVWGHVGTSQVLCEEPSGAGSRAEGKS